MTEREIGRIFAKLEEMHHDIKELRIANKELEARVNALEKTKHMLMGIITVVTTFSTYLVAKLKGLL